MGRGSKRSRTQRYREQRFRESREAAGYTQESFSDFVEKNEKKSRLARQVWEHELVEYNQQAELVINKEKTKSAAADLVKETQDAGYSRDYLVSTYESASGRKLNQRAAEDRINHEQAIRARAILVTSEVGKVKLTEAQKERLHKVERGGYLELIYGQYKSGDRGTLQGTKKDFTGAGATGSASEAERAEKARYFRTEVRGSRRSSDYTAVGRFNKSGRQSAVA